MRTSSVLDRFIGREIKQSGTELYFDRSTALEIIDCCAKARIPILGLDGARIDERGHQELLEWSLNLSASPHDYDASRRHLHQPQFAGLAWLLTLDEPP